MTHLVEFVQGIRPILGVKLLPRSSQGERPLDTRLVGGSGMIGLVLGAKVADDLVSAFPSGDPNEWLATTSGQTFVQMCRLRHVAFLSNCPRLSHIMVLSRTSDEVEIVRQASPSLG